MRIQIGSLQITIGKAAVPVTTWPTTSPFIRESFPGAWQRGITVPVSDALQNPTYFACVTMIAGDIAKCCFELFKEDRSGIYNEVDVPAFSSTLREPNQYQNQSQFIEQWVLSKLCYGNTIVLKGRDDRNVVDSCYILDWNRVRPMVSTSGQVFYALSTDQLAGQALDQIRPIATNDRGDSSVVVPASEVIHDRWNCFYHPLVGLGPVYAAGALTSQGQQITMNASRLAQQGFRPGGVITSAEPISQENAEKFEKYWMDNYTGSDNAGRIIVLGGGLKYEKPPAMTAVESDLIKQLSWGDEKICSCFHMPPYKVGVGTIPGTADTAALATQYYSQCLQVLVTAIETCWGQGIGAEDAGYEVGFDEEELMRMDPVARMTFTTAGVKGGIFAPNEGRKRFNYKPLTGGDTVYLQEQDHSLEALAKRDSGADPFGTAKPPAPKPAPSAAAPPPPAKTWSADEAYGTLTRLLETADV